MLKPNIILTGFMGTGKTVVGKALADVLKMKYIDTDAMIEEETGKTIPHIFEKFGEATFRRHESDAIKKLTGLSGFVVSTGGGAVISDDNIENMRRAGVVICLTAAPNVILDRVKNNDNRPLLKTPDPLKKIHSLMAIREPQYRKADHKIDTSNLRVSEVVKKIIEIWRTLK